MNKIKVVEYRPEWKYQYLVEKELLKSILDDIIVSIHHIGSTSIHGLCAKPIIDILLGVSNLDKLDYLSDKMETAGYIPKGEFGIRGRRYYQKGEIERTHQIHAFKYKDSNIIRHIAFRDYLRTHPKIKSEYGNIKKQAVLNCDNDIERYMDFKNDFIKHHESQAISWMNSAL